LCDIHNIKHHKLELAFDEELTAAHLAAYTNKGITGLLVNIHETSTGQLFDAKMLSEFCKKENLLFIIDAISSFLADPLDMNDIAADAIIFSSHKSMALNPGISCVVISPKAYAERVEGNKTKVLYLDFNNHINDLKRGQTPFTPAVNVALTMNDMLGSICKVGINEKIKQTREIALDFRSKIKAIKNVEVPSFPLSNALTPLVFHDGEAKKVYEILCNEYGLMLTPNGGELADKVLRVGHIGNHTIAENDEIITALKEIYNKEFLK
jgi:aspartate aminotransferase-like enzyme